jgi:glycosyltransferase involved in cell wall biosynthesis
MQNTASKVPTVTVLMPVYNNERYLKDAIESIINQTFIDFEFLIICDDPSDNIRSILDHYQDLDGRIKTLYYQERQGLVATLNKGCELAKGKYIARMDADDISYPQRLKLQVDFLDTHPHIGVVGSMVQFIDSNGNKKRSNAYTSGAPLENGFIRWRMCFSCPIAHPTVMMRKDIMRRAGGYSPNMIHAEDYDLWRRMSSLTQLSNLPDPLLYIRIHDTNVSKIHNEIQRRNSLRIKQLVISEVLNEEISPRVIQYISNCRCSDSESDDVYAASKIVQRLCQSFLSDDTISAVDKHLIRRDAAIQMMILVRRYMINRNLFIKNIYDNISFACKLDPLIPFRSVFMQFLDLLERTGLPPGWWIKR